MIHSGRAARHARMHRRHRHQEELNLVSLIDIFSVLVFFLIVNFGDMSVLDLNLPAAATEPQPEDQQFHLEVTVRADRIEVGDRDRDLLQAFPNTPQGYDTAALNDFLQRLKTQHQDTRDASLLLEPEIAYDTVVQVMDAMRQTQREVDGKPLRAELFPKIAVGDAPAAPAASPAEAR